MPGIPLAIVYPDKKFTLIDSNGKKIRFLLHTLYQLAIRNTQALEINILNFQPVVLFDIILSRALASLSDIATLSQPLLAKDGKILAMKGKYPHSELATVSNWHSEVIPTANLCDTGARHLVIMHQHIPEINNENI